MLKKSKIFCNKIINKKELKNLIESAFKNYGQRKAAYFVDQLKEIGFEYATKSGLSISLEDLKVPPAKKSLMANAIEDVSATELEVNNGEITEVERFQKIIYIWNNTSEDLKTRVVNYFQQNDPLNSVYIMAFSGARGNLSQVRQLVGMRGLMSDPNGQIIDLPIKSNFREGLSITDYIISSYGARKGLVDTAIKTADSGYLTRRLVEVAQRIIISELDCKTERGILLHEENENKDNEISLPLKRKAIGRVLAVPILNPHSNEILGYKNEQITLVLLEKLANLKIKKIIIRSPLTCECRRSVCQQCYGWNLASANLVELGESVGIIAAQSIGEPGTQLTMRTFHTGGVFTSEIMRQARAEYSGYISFLPNLKTKTLRTNYGKDALISENDSHIRLITYTNEIKKIRIAPGTVILTKDNVYKKKNDVLFELPSRTKQIRTAEKEIKYILAKRPGEIILENKGFRQRVVGKDFKTNTNPNQLFWILSGQVYDIPLKANIRVRELEKVYKNQSLAQSKITTILGGFISFLKNQSTQEVNNIKINNSYKSLKNLKIYIEQNNFGITSCKIYLSYNYNIVIKPGFFNHQVFLLGFLNNKKYKSQTGGTFFIVSFSEPNAGINKQNRKIKPGSTIFYIPESTIYTSTKIKDFNFKKGTYISKETEIFPNYFTSIEGFINFEGRSNIKKINIKPGFQFFLSNKLINFEEIDQQIYYPGEILFDKIKIKTLSFLEVQSSNNKGTFIYLRPITRYELTKENFFKNVEQNSFIDINLKIENFILNATSGIDLESDTPIQFVRSPITLQYPLHFNNLNIDFEFKKSKKRSWVQATLHCSQLLSMDTLIPTEMKKEEIKINLLIEEKQFIEPYSIIGSFDILAPYNNLIYKIKQKHTGKKRTIILTTKTDYKSIYLEDFSHPFKKNQLIKSGQSFGRNLTIRESGVIEEVQGNKITYHLGQPYLFSKGALIQKIPGDFIKTHENFGQLVYERLKTGDIVQGLPKVEEILEARKPKNEALIAARPGIIESIHKNSMTISLFIKPSFFFGKDYTIACYDRLIVKEFEFINVGQPLTEGSLNPHTLLSIYFKYFCSLGTLSTYESAYRSIKKVQALLINSVQAVYFSQGVIIADKHIELIIREMTNKVYIEYPGETNFLPGDILDLEQVNYINLCLQKEKDKILFSPILLGITKSSLKADGFLAAASFQETTRVLTQAAIQGKTDWMQGLKENVITGGLIPAGTGFHMSNDLTYNKVMLPKPLLKNKEHLTLTRQLKLKSKHLRPFVTFKYNK